MADDPEILDQIMQTGAKFQVNWDSFSGAYGRRVAKVARSMAHKGFIHCLATVSHGPNVRNAGTVYKIGRQIPDLIGNINLRCIAEENPIRVIQNQHLLEMDHNEMPQHVVEKGAGRKMWFWHRFRMVGRGWEERKR